LNIERSRFQSANCAAAKREKTLEIGRVQDEGVDGSMGVDPALDVDPGIDAAEG
jgi:hypothetical protein